MPDEEAAVLAYGQLPLPALTLPEFGSKETAKSRPENCGVT
jgi:hypothetical protein